MNDLERSVERLRPRLRPRWTPERAGEAERGLLARRRRAVAFRRGAAALLLLLLPLLGAEAWRRLPQRSHPPAAPSSSVVAVPLSEGSVAYLLGEGSALREVPGLAGPGRRGARTIVVLDRGAARFAVRHDPRRFFRVEAGAVAVEVIGTRFVVARSPGQVDVDVEEGRVRVRRGGAAVELGAGQRASFPDATQAPPAPVPEAAPPGPEGPPAARAGGPPHAAALRGDQESHPGPPSDTPQRAGSPLAEQPAVGAPRASWQDLAQEGEYDRAYEVLARAPSAAPSGAADLLLAADTARLSHHPAEAVAPLRQLLREHPADSRAPLGAFTLGRVLLDELGRPREAAEAFLKAQELAPGGPLAQDALAREVESWARAGDQVRARLLAERYLASYPEGRRLRAVKRHGGLE